MSRLVIFGVGAIAAFIAGCVVVIALATRDGGAGGGAAPGSAPAASDQTTGRSADGAVVRRGGWATVEASPDGVLSLPPLPPEPAHTDGVRRLPPEQMKAVDWRNRQKPPRSAEDLN